MSILDRRSTRAERPASKLRARLGSILLLAITLVMLAPAIASAQSDAVSVEFEGLAPLGSELVYEGWLIIDGTPYSSGTFNIGESGEVVPINQVDVPNFEDSTDYVLTIEPAVDPDPAPAPTHILGGSFSNGTAELGLSHPQAFGFTFEDASGSYIIKTPTTDSEDDELSGVWFLDPTGDAGPVASLDLPVLPAGWVYEGWAVVDGQPLTTGRFTDVAAADDFSEFSGPLPGPPFPGEDLVANAPDGLVFPTDLRGDTVAITVEPEPDDSPAPFALHPLEGIVPADVEVGVPVALPQGFTEITGTATLNATAPPAELAVTGAETWYLVIGAAALLVIGVAMTLSNRRTSAARR